MLNTILVYYPGKGNKGDWYHTMRLDAAKGIQDYLMENGSDSIVIMSPYSYDGSVRNERAVNLANSFIEEYKLNSNAVTFSGFSLGAASAIDSVVLNIKNNPDLEPQTLMMVIG